MVFSIADNQDLIFRELIDMGIKYLGKYPDIEYKKLKKLIGRIKDKVIYENEKVFNLIDGRGTIVVAKVLIKEI